MILKQGDRIGVTYSDEAQRELPATVAQVLSDQEEGLSPEVQDYVALWMEIHLDEPGAGQTSLMVTFGTDSQYYIEGRRVILRKL